MTASKTKKFKPNLMLGVMIVAAIGVIALVMIFGGTSTAKFYNVAQWQKLDALVSYDGGQKTLDFSAFAAGKEMPTNNIKLRILTPGDAALCITSVSTPATGKLPDAPICSGGCDQPIIANLNIRLSLKASRCDPSTYRQGTIMTAQLLFPDSKVNVEGKFVV